MLIGTIGPCLSLSIAPFFSPQVPASPGMSAAPAAVSLSTGSLPYGPADTRAAASPQAATSPAAARLTKSAQEAAPPQDDEPSSPRVETWGEFDPGKGFVIGKGKAGELSLSAYAMVRYIYQMPAGQTFTDHLGNEHPIAAFANSDGDHQMLQWTAAGAGARFLGLIHHTDAEREWAYDRASSIGRHDKALDEAKEKGWTVISMKDDWKRIFPFEAK